MTFTERPKVNERQMAKYDWVRTSFAQEQIATSAFVTDAAAMGPRLIMDCDSDDESEGEHPPGDVAINMEGTSEKSGADGGSGENTSNEDEEDYDPRNYECEDNLQGDESRGSFPRTEEEIENESRGSLPRTEEEIENESRGSLPRTEEEISQEGPQEDCKNQVGVVGMCFMLS